MLKPKSNKYTFESIDISKLILNPQNARFYSGQENESEFDTVNEMLNLKDSHIVPLALDIDKNDLNSHELLIVKPIENNQYFVLEGNRRTTAIKLMTQYKNELQNLDLRATDIKKLLVTKYNNTMLPCVVSSDDDYINQLLERTHTAKKGISRAMWNPLAADNFRDSLGQPSKRKTLLDMVLSSEFCTEKVIEIASSDRWIAQFARFTKKNDVMRNYFGVEFIDNENVLLIWNEKITVERLCQLIYDCKALKASEMAQTDELIDNYLNNNILDFNVLNPSEFNNPIIAYNHEVNQFYPTDKENKHYREIELPTVVASPSKTAPTITENTSMTSSSHNIVTHPTTDLISEIYPDITIESELLDDIDPVLDPGLKRGPKPNITLISRKYHIPISDQRVQDLFAELKKLPLNHYINVGAIGFRSLIEFTVNIYIEKVMNKKLGSYHSLEEKVIAVYKRISGNIGAGEAKKFMPAFSIDIESDKISECGVISILNTLIHNHNLHPTISDLQQSFKNYYMFLKFSWSDINKFY